MKGTLAVAAVVLLALVLDIQVVRADSFVVRPHLGLQGDGGRRYAYNPRVLDVARQMVRGSVFDRRGLPLATGDPAVVERSRAAYAKLGVSLAEVCPSAAERCYPLGGRAFHLLGDARTRANWSAGNSSYIERDDEAALRGFDDRAEVVATTDAAGRSMSTIRRDYRDLLPLVRHRYEPDHPDVAALRQRTHDIRLTIDAALQIRVAAIVEAHAKNTTGRAAAVVLDPDSGAVLASVSYPWPSAAVDGRADEGESDALLDRARYGLYPPGSTFKLVTAAAALSRDSSLASTTFSCVRLPDGRSGAKLPGWTRPVRDDVLDSHPHGSIDLHEAVIHSCNAYFAQLAVKLGPQPLIECAGRLGIALTPSAAPTVRVRDTLPQVGYGQADVRATPLRMARLAAGIAASGVIQDARWKQNTVPAGHPFLPAPAARMLAADMRAVVTRGTGSSLRNHPWRIAGKTGTAEVDGAASHGWFVGFAPYGAATQRIAFAIVLEHAGYGGRTAAPVAGEIVTAAGELGLMR
jgi:membrane carboxypeptidase/penicillin-binding protein